MSPEPLYILGAGMHPWGKWGRDFTEYGVVAARAALVLGWPGLAGWLVWPTAIAALAMTVFALSRPRQAVTGAALAGASLAASCASFCLDLQAARLAATSRGRTNRSWPRPRTRSPRNPARPARRPSC